MHLMRRQQLGSHAREMLDGARVDLSRRRACRVSTSAIGTQTSGEERAGGRDPRTSCATIPSGRKPCSSSPAAMQVGHETEPGWPEKVPAASELMVCFT